MLHAEGETWSDLPETGGKFTQKTFWWSTDYLTNKQPPPPLVLTGRRLDEPGSFETGGPAGGGVRDDIGSFMLVGMEIPAGCWELTATYRGSQLSYVVQVEDWRVEGGQCRGMNKSSETKWWLNAWRAIRTER